MIVDDTMEPSEERVTLTQRRGHGPTATGASKLNRSKFQSIESEPEEEFEEEPKGSASKVIIWVLIVVILAVVAFLALRGITSKNDESGTTTPTPTVKVQSLEDKLVAAEVVDDSQALNAKPAVDFTVADKTIGKTGTDKFSLADLNIQKYTTFTRIQFTVLPPEGATEIVPLTTASYNAATSSIILAFNKISPDDSGLAYGKTVNVNTNVVTSVSHDIDAASQTEKYNILVTSNTGFVLQTFVDKDTNSQLVVLDIKETAVAPTTATVSGTVTATPKVTTTSSVTPTTQSTTGFATEYSSDAQEIVTSTTGNVVSLKTFTGWQDTSAAFLWKITWSIKNDQFPNVKAHYEGNNLVVEVANYAIKTKAMTTVATTKARDVSKVEVSVTNNVAKYVFYLNKVMQYKMEINKDTNLFTVSIKH